MPSMINTFMSAFTLLSSIIAVNALPLETLISVSPPITSPNETTIWHVGDTVTVTWDTSDLPPPENITNPEGKIILGFETFSSLNLDFDSPLIEDFPITVGQVSLVVPNVPLRTNYIIVLMGNSGNTSPLFTIEGGSGSEESISATTDLSSPTTSETDTTSSLNVPASRTPSIPRITITPSTTNNIPIVSSGSIQSSMSPSESGLSTPDNGGNVDNNVAGSSKHVHMMSIVFVMITVFLLLF